MLCTLNYLAQQPQAGFGFTTTHFTVGQHFFTTTGFGHGAGSLMIVASGKHRTQGHASAVYTPPSTNLQSQFPANRLAPINSAAPINNFFIRTSSFNDIQ